MLLLIPNYFDGIDGCPYKVKNDSFKYKKSLADFPDETEYINTNMNIYGNQYH